MTAEGFITAIEAHRNENRPESILKFFHGDDGDTEALGIPFGTVFKLAKDHIGLPLVEISTLLDSKYYEVRMGAVSIMDFQAKSKKTTKERKEQLFNLYLDRHDRLNDWGFVDRGAYNIIGEYLVDKPRDVLYELATSNVVWFDGGAMFFHCFPLYCGAPTQPRIKSDGHPPKRDLPG